MGAIPDSSILEGRDVESLNKGKLHEQINLCGSGIDHYVSTGSRIHDDRTASRYKVWKSQMNLKKLTKAHLTTE
jgi:hypothetical protein